MNYKKVFDFTIYKHLRHIFVSIIIATDGKKFLIIAKNLVWKVAAINWQQYVLVRPIESIAVSPIEIIQNPLAFELEHEAFTKW